MSRKMIALALVLGSSAVARGQQGEVVSYFVPVVGIATFTVDEAFILTDVIAGSPRASAH